MPLGSPEGPRWRSFLEHLSVERVADGRYQAMCLAGRSERIFGGQVAAQAVVAASAESASGMVPLSEHVQFLRAGDPRELVEYVVTNMRIGRSFQHWRVEAEQAGRCIASVVVALHHPDPSRGPSHSIPNLDSSRPESLPDITAATRPGTQVEIRRGLDIRQGLVWTPEAELTTPYKSVWYRCTEELGDDPIMHAAVLVWASDLEMTWTVDLPYRVGVKNRKAASLDHVVYFHAPLDARAWWLYEQKSPVLEHGRALALGRVFAQNGGLLASVSQQSLLRLEMNEPQTIL